jgi:hypothetical protein
MQAKRTKLMVGCLLGISLCLMAGIVTLVRYQRLTSCYDGRPPLRSIQVTIDTSQSQQLIEQSQKFADKHGFSFQTAFYNPSGTDFSIWMKREDVEVIARSPFNPGEFRIGFYNYDCIHPTVASDIEDLVVDLKSLISEIPDVTVIEQ